MPNGEFICTEHSGCIRRLDHLELTDKELWEKVNRTNDKIDTIMTRINFILGGIAVSCVLLAINILVKAVGGG